VRRIEEMSERSRILVLASHSLETLRQFCNHGIIMRRGQILERGPIGDVIAKYGI
jgi:ABC-type polysaccharide/polyol phosphate transport system ATPase subunit